MNRAEITPDVLQSLLSYDAEAGVLTWKPRPPGRDAKRFNARYAGSVAGSLTAKGRLSISVYGVMFLAHRVAWAVHTGAWPRDEIDHINRDPLDNRAANLREATHEENCRNQPSKGGTSQYVGVHYFKRNRKWCAAIRYNGKRRHIGHYACETAAMLARRKASSALFKEFAPA